MVKKIKELPFVGRRPEIKQAAKFLGEPSVSEGSNAIWITGERGAGKTRFIRELASQANKLGFQVVFYRCEEQDRHHSFGTLSAIIRILLGKPQDWKPRNIKTLTNAVNRRFEELVLAGDEAELVLWLLGAGKPSQYSSDLDEQSRRGLISVLFNRFLEHQLQGQPFLLIAIDDLHFCDQLSRSHLLEGSSLRGLALAVTAPSLSVAVQRGEARELSLPPFSEKEVGRLLSVRFGKAFPADRFVPELLKITSGNPLHLVQIMTSVPSDEEAPVKLSEMLEGRQPDEILRAALERFKPLDVASTTLIKYASVIGDRFPFQIVRQMLGPAFPLDKAVRKLKRCRLAWVETNADGRDLFLFEHATVRDAAYSMLGAIEKERLHAVTAAMLKRYYGKRSHEHLMSVAGHFESAGANINAARAYFEAGEYYKKLGDFPSAEEALRKAQELFEDNEKRLEAMAEYITVLGAQSRIEECEKVSSRLFESNPGPGLHAKALGTLAHVQAVAGNLDEAADYAGKALKLAEEAENRAEIVKACTHLAYVHASKENFEEALDFGNRAREAAQELGDDRLLGGAFQALATANWAADDPENARQMYELAARKFEKSGHLYNVAVMKQNTGVMLQAMGELEAALEAYEETARSHERMGALTSLGVTKCNIASVLLYLGQYRKCLSLLDESGPFFARLKSPALAALASMTKASCLVRMGETEKALPLLRKGWKARKRAGRWSDMGQFVEVLIQAAAVTGDAAEALDESKAFLEEAEKRSAKKAHRHALALRLEALLLTKKKGEAEKIATLIEDANTSRRNNYSRALTFALLARFAAVKGNAGQAGNFLNEAFSTGRLNRESQAALNFHVGRAMLKEGRPAEAKQFLEKAKDEYSILAAAGYRKHELEKCSELLLKLST